jgi:ketosteroid isomerase-like protein
MKKIIITFVCSCLIISNLQAQSSFNEEVFRAMMTRLQTDPAFFKNETDPDFSITFGNGATSSREDMLKYAENNIGLYKRIESNVKVRQTGSLAIVTGTVDENFLLKTNPSVVRRTGKEIFTYTFSQINGKWLWVSGQHTDFKKPAFTAATMKEIFDEYKADSKAFFINRLSDDFRYIPRDGKFQNKEDVLKGNKQNIVSTELLQPVIFQSGDLVVTNGIHQTVRIDKDGKEVTSQVACTYTWQRRNDKWMFVGSEQSAIQAPVADDEAAIKQVIEGESTAFFQRNTEQLLTYWANVPYVSHSYNEKGSGYIRGYDKYSDVVKKFVSEHPELSKYSFKNRDYIIHINGTSAWATHIQEQSAGDNKNTAYSSTYLEKNGSGVWKIVGHGSSDAK